MTDNRLFLVCASCGKRLCLATHDSVQNFTDPSLRGWVAAGPAGEIGGFLDRHRHSVPVLEFESGISAEAQGSHGEPAGPPYGGARA